ncbi:MAG: B12-binding domain-containing radical SAM protein [Acidobacteriia bacterium]|nr:B12-binding domain-containing radical SAM protein [Terriglobia bacterium]
MILLYNPRATKPRNRRHPLSILALAAVLEGREDYEMIDGNVDQVATETICRAIQKDSVELLAVTVMPGPQMVAAVESCRRIRALFPRVPIVWGGYFPSIYADAALNAPYVDFAVRGQGEETLLELLDALRGKRALASIRGLSFKDAAGKHRHNPERLMKGPDAFPWYPYHRLPAEKYLLPSFFGRRTAAHHASIGCPYQCSFCGVVPAYGKLEKMESPARTEAILRHLKRNYGMDSVQFYDMNFFLREDHARELADRMATMGLRWWCEARVDVMLRYSDATFEAIRRAGCAMIFFGAESGSDWVLKEMNKHLKAEQTLELSRRIRQFGIIPEFSFVLGNPKDPERDTRECLQFIRRIKGFNPASEIIIYHYTPVPQRERMYGNVEGKIAFPETPEEWATERWQDFAVRKDPMTPWLKPMTKRRIDNFRMVVSSRWPTVQDIRLPAWGRRLLKALSAWRYRLGFYAFPFELRFVQRLIQLRKPEAESL